MDRSQLKTEKTCTYICNVNLRHELKREDGRSHCREDIMVYDFLL